MNTNKRSELTHRSELTQKVKNTNNNHYHKSEIDNDVDEASSMPVSTLSVPLHHPPPDTPMSTIVEPMVEEIIPPPPPIEYEQQSIEYEHPKEDQPQSSQSELPKNNSSKRVLEKSISGLKTLKSMAGSSMTTLLQSSGTGGGDGGGKNNGIIISPTNRMKAMLLANSSSKRDGQSSDINGGIPPPPPPPAATTTTPSSPSSADDILRDLSNGVSSSDEGRGVEPRPHSGKSLENYVLPSILRMDMMDNNTTTNHHQGGGMEVIKVSKVCSYITFCLLVLFLQ
jgi:hypothetical protein